MKTTFRKILHKHTYIFIHLFILVSIYFLNFKMAGSHLNFKFNFDLVLNFILLPSHIY